MDLFPDKRILTVSQLTSLVRGVIEENFEHVWVEGEVSNLSMPGSGHLYFTLRDAGAQLRCVMFRAAARALRFRPKDGVGLIVRGRLTVFEPRGDYQLIVEYLEPQGIGALQLAFSQLKERLAGEGMFDESRKKPIPRLPRRIGVVTSATGAAIHDILNVLERRFANVEVLLRPVRVQGEGAAAEIAGAVRDFNRYRDIDVMIVGRGGGSMEDLWAFNEEVVARAIHASRIPVISAVGHEVDFTIADFVADLRAPTPSAAAELVIKSKEELEAGVAALSHRLGQAMRHRLAGARGELESLSRSLKDPSMLLGHLVQRVDHSYERLCAAAAAGMRSRAERLDYLRNHLRLVTPAVQLERARERLISLAARGENAIQRIVDRNRESAAVNAGRLHSLSPLLTLSRGYAIACRLPERTAVRDGGSLSPGDRLDLTFQRGGALCVVEESHD
ncbi:MAG: exodeoxyribonuclease VII large subunit [Geobacteraceae bacterium]|nr:exodeoxyribonuclease VII large subunit [Geobacteraceae bacterium]